MTLTNHVLSAKKKKKTHYMHRHTYPNSEQQEGCDLSEFSKWKDSILKIIMLIGSLQNKKWKYSLVSDFKDWYRLNKNKKNLPLALPK